MRPQRFAEFVELTARQLIFRRQREGLTAVVLEHGRHIEPVRRILLVEAANKAEVIASAAGRRYVVRVNLYRKPGQSGVNPQLPTQLTQGQFESSARLDVYALDKP